MSVPGFDRSNTTSFQLDGDVLLFVESSTQLILLNETASSIWRGLEAAMPVSEIAAELASRTGGSIEDVTRDCARSIDAWRKLGVFDSGVGTRSAVVEPDEAAGSPERASSEPAPELRFAKPYRLLDLTFFIRATHASDARRVHEFIAHLASREDPPVDVIFDLKRLGGGYTLQRDGVMMAECDAPEGLVPMVHANLLLAAYGQSDCLAALHAAALARGDRCVLMPGVSGSGKSTLTAALLAHGFEYCTDDLVILTGDPVRVRAYPMRIGLKRGAWDVLASRWPEIATLPVHERADGQSIRYFLPQRCLDPDAGPVTHEPTCILFPTYDTSAGCELRRIRPSDALLRLTDAGYDLPSRMDRDVVSVLVEWVSATPCYELRFSRIDEAVDAVSMIVP